MRITHRPDVLPIGLPFDEPVSPRRQEGQVVEATGPSARPSSGKATTGLGAAMRRTVTMMLAAQVGVLAGRTPGKAQQDPTFAGKHIALPAA